MTEINLNNLKSVLFIYDSELGHSSMYSRGLVHKPMLDKFGWANEFVDFRSCSEQDLVEKAKLYNVIYLIKMASVSLVRRIKKETTSSVIFELADALWQPLHRRHGWQDLEKILIEVDLIAVENKYLSDFAKKYNKFLCVPVITHPERFEAARKVKPIKADNSIIIGWIGSTGTVGALINIKDQLREIFSRNSNAELRIVGCKDLNLLSEISNFPGSIVTDYNEEQMINEIVSFDIGLFPPPFDIEDYISRGAQKTLLYMQGGAASVSLNEGECADVVTDGVSGMLINNPGEWITKTEQLIRNKSLRDKISEKGIEIVTESHSSLSVFKKLEEVFYTVIDRKK